MSLNISKCSVMRFSRKRALVECPYGVTDTALSVISSVRDLGVTFTPSLSFAEHYRNIVLATSRALGFIIKSTSKFRKPTTLRILYSALVLPHLEYCSPIWNPYHQVHINSLERVQHKFLCSVAYKMGQPMPFFCHRYDPIEMSGHAYSPTAQNCIGLNVRFQGYK